MKAIQEKNQKDQTKKREPRRAPNGLSLPVLLLNSGWLSNYIQTNVIFVK